MKTAFIVDSDLAFGFWLARGLDHAGYQAYPSKSVADAIALRAELHTEIDLLILNAGLADSAEWIETLRQAHSQMRVVALIGDQSRLPGIAARVDLCCRKPDRHDDGKLREWIEHVEELLPASLFGAAFENSILLRKCAGALVWRAGRTEAPAWKEWEGRTIDGRFQLERCLGGSEQSAVFLTRRGYDGEDAAAIRVVLNEVVDREVLLPRWERAARLSHPGLIRVFDIGSAECGGAAVSYLVMEYAEENLADVLRQRPLTASETRELLEPVLDALSYLHRHGLVHGHVKPSNILAVADQLKISSDGLRPAGEQPAALEHAGAYAAPESTAGFLSPAADVWSLGITLVEALTQRPLVPKRPQHKTPAIPVTLPPLFLDIARQCLQPDPERRETVEHLADRLRRAPAAESAPAPAAPRSLLRFWPYAVPAMALGLAFSGVLMRPHQTVKAVAPPAAPAVAPVPALAPPHALPPPPLTRSVAAQVLPDVSQDSRATIRGTLQVRIQVRVDASGSVVDAKLDEPGPSRYFANRALDAARRWKFDALAPGRPPDPENWILRFDYTRSGTQASAEHVAP
ncbi:MAG TPA: TonB family protein [Bryobacteraceae bacterium]|nr:TonB family protein [Bryobacteraceae bacterium]